MPFSDGESAPQHQVRRDQKVSRPISKVRLARALGLAWSRHRNERRPPTPANPSLCVADAVFLRQHDCEPPSSVEKTRQKPLLCFTNARLFLLGPLSFSSTVSPSSPSFSQARAPHLPIDFCSAHPQLSHTRKGSPQVSSGSIARRAPRALRVH